MLISKEATFRAEKDAGGHMASPKKRSSRHTKASAGDQQFGRSLASFPLSAVPEVQASVVLCMGPWKEMEQDSPESFMVGSVFVL